MTKLELVPHLNEMTRTQIEAHVEQVQVRRMAAALVYAQGQAERNAEAFDKASRMVQQEFTMLGRELESLDKQIAKVEKRLEKIAVLQQRANQFLEAGLETDNDGE